MKNETRSLLRKSAIGFAVVISFTIGSLLSDDSAEVQRLLSELAELDQTRKPGFQASAAGSIGRKRTAAPVFGSASTPAGSSEPEITTEELAEQHELNRKFYEKGEYKLKYEGMAMWKGLAKEFDRYAEGMKTRVAAEYGAKFASLGIDSETSRLLQAHLVKMKRSEREADAFSIQVQEARLAYDERIRTLMTEDHYAKYREYEDSKRSLHTVEELETAAATAGTQLDPTSRDTILGLIHESEAYSSRAHGKGSSPYHPAPPPVVGVAASREVGRESLQALTQRADQLLQKAADGRLSDPALGLLRQFYSAEISNLHNGIENLKSLPEDRFWPTKKRPENWPIPASDAAGRRP